MGVPGGELHPLPACELAPEGGQHGVHDLLGLCTGGVHAFIPHHFQQLLERHGNMGLSRLLRVIHQ
jgi:hypothetical protein